jgi:hypothetical protein
VDDPAEEDRGVSAKTESGQSGSWRIATRGLGLGGAAGVRDAAVRDF